MEIRKKILFPLLSQSLPVRQPADGRGLLRPLAGGEGGGIFMREFQENAFPLLDKEGSSPLMAEKGVVCQHRNS